MEMLDRIRKPLRLENSLVLDPPPIEPPSSRLIRKGILLEVHASTPKDALQHLTLCANEHYEVLRYPEKQLRPDGWAHLLDFVVVCAPGDQRRVLEIHAL